MTNSSFYFLCPLTSNLETWDKHLNVIDRALRKEEVFNEVWTEKRKHVLSVWTNL